MDIIISNSGDNISFDYNFILPGLPYYDGKKLIMPGYFAWDDFKSIISYDGVYWEKYIDSSNGDWINVGGGILTLVENYNPPINKDNIEQLENISDLNINDTSLNNLLNIEYHFI